MFSAVDGREIKPVKEEQLIEECKVIKEKGLRNVRARIDYEMLDMGADCFARL